MEPLDPKWTEETLRAWAESHAPSGYVQARQVIDLLNELAYLRQQNAKLKESSNI